MTPVWDTSCKDWEKRILAGESLIPFSPLFPAEAEAALDVFKSFRVRDIQGAPTVGEIARPWITDFAGAFFGAYDPESGKRLIQTFYLKVPKKNWKSGITAFMMGTLLVRNWRESGEFGIIAPTAEVAANAFGPLAHAIRIDEELSDLLLVQDHIKTITHRTTKAKLQVVAAESDTVSGKKFAVTLVEELWRFGKRRNADSMFQEAAGGMASRPEGAVIYITTESDEAPAGVYKAKNDYARKVRDGEIVDPSFLPVMYEWPRHMIESKACLDIENAHVTNPNLGASVSYDFLRSKSAETKAESDKAFQSFCAKHMNVEIGLALGSDRWAGADFWEQCARPGLTLESIIERSDVIAAGIDVGQTDDLLGLAVIGRDAETQDWLLWVHAWVHEIALDRRKSIAPTLRDFEKQGDLTIYSEHGTDVTEVSALMQMLEETGKLNNIGCDPCAIEAFVQEMIRLGVPQEKLIGISQGYKMMGSIIAAERALAKGTLIHSGCKMMAWCVGNAKIEPVGNAIKITKQAAGTAKIDPVLAMLNAVHLMSIIPAGNSNSYLNDSELLYI